LMEETGVPGENHRPVTCHWQTLSHNVVSTTLCHEQGFSNSDNHVSLGILKVYTFISRVQR
jgi:hypothetical protein